MRRLIAFIQTTLDGYFAAVDGDIGWAHRSGNDEEWNAFVAGNADSGGELVFGRITYQMMASYWPTPAAAATDATVAAAMNRLPKIVFSRTLKRASWSNTRLLKGDPATEIRKLKGEPGAQMVILGSGSLVAQLAGQGLIDEFQVVINPLALGQGRSLFEGVVPRLDLRLTGSRTFANGNALLCYEPDR